MHTFCTSTHTKKYYYSFILKPSLNKVMRSCHKDMDSVIKIITASCWDLVGGGGIEQTGEHAAMYSGAATA